MELEPVEDARLSPSMSVRDLIEALRKIHGFTASSIVDAIEVLREASKSCDVMVLSFTANLVATGLRGVLAQLIEEGPFNVVFTTCGTLDHDIARSFGARYLRGVFDANDEELAEKGIHRLGNVFIPVTDYGPLIEKTLYRLLDEIVLSSGKREWGVRELLHEIGARIDDRNSILRVCASKGVPIYVPGFVDGAFGTTLLTYSRLRGLRIDALKDQQELADIFFRAKRVGGLIIGGGISKHHAIWWSQFAGGMEYAVYITTAVEWDGSLSGARPREAVTWGKIRPRARKVVVYGDATVLLPIIAYGVLYTA